MFSIEPVVLSTFILTAGAIVLSPGPDTVLILHMPCLPVAKPPGRRLSVCSSASNRPYPTCRYRHWLLPSLQYCSKASPWSGPSILLGWGYRDFAKVVILPSVSTHQRSAHKKLWPMLLCAIYSTQKSLSFFWCFSLILSITSVMTLPVNSPSQQRLRKIEYWRSGFYFPMLGVVFDQTLRNRIL